MFQKSLLSLFCLALVFGTVQQAKAQSAADKSAIMDVIHAETAAFYKRDAKAWQDTWLHDEQASRTIVVNGYSATVGWKNFGPQMIKNLKENSGPSGVKFTDENFMIHSDGMMAWVEFDQTLSTPEADQQYKQLTREHRVLVKKNDKWKILSQITHFPATLGSNPGTLTTNSEALENSLYSTGYDLLEAGMVEAAIEVFKVNADLYPNSWNVYEGLGEAYAKSGNKEMAIANYEKLLRLDPANENGKTALERLKDQE
ncbi:SnoaL-like domain-containing protein [Catalinimonas alkaloidigena]|uniref:SnoaL-like domain-containing protein n=1 Tax=Catalinimonas alkaloidigena TaxID=1075417 RepID=A0A1G9K4G9_9BACT|nr:tetratricopeptide repeat protein [Catalinimonas alkaloidigena]SDL44255.1 SnoaL-like domain-containing protein [Catalinimonas alkaloidigena]